MMPKQSKNKPFLRYKVSLDKRGRERVRLDSWDKATFLKLSGVDGCEVCGETRWLDIHHRDHNRKNNSIENLAIYCPNHHRMVHHGNNQTLVCGTCGKKFLVVPGQQYRANKWCSWACRMKKVAKQCPVCGDSFEVGAANVSQGRRIYCSRLCQNRGMAAKRRGKGA